jgi:hypothetical protein
MLAASQEAAGATVTTGVASVPSPPFVRATICAGGFVVAVPTKACSALGVRVMTGFVTVNDTGMDTGLLEAPNEVMVTVPK